MMKFSKKMCLTFTCYHLAVMALCGSVFGNDIFSIKQTGANSITVAFSIAANQHPSAIIDDTLFFGFSSLQSGVLPVSVSIDATGSTALLSPGYQKATAGFIGTNFITWIRIPLGSSHDGRSGSINLTYDPTQFNLSEAKIAQGMLLVPQRTGLAKATSAQKPQLPYHTGIKLEVSSDGIYQIKASQLRTLGVDYPSIPSKQFRLFNKDVEIPIYITNSHRSFMGTEDMIMFYGTSLKGTSSWYAQFSFTNVYWLTWGVNQIGARMAEGSGSLRRDELQYSATADTVQLKAGPFMDTLHCEEDNDIQWLGNVTTPVDMNTSANSEDTLDNWYWGVVGSDQLTSFSILVPSPVTNMSAKLRINFRGLTTVENQSPDHKYTILLNDNAPGNTPQIAQWDGQSNYTFETSWFSAPQLLNGKNTITFSRDPRGFEDRSALNWIEVIYKRSFGAFDNQSMFHNDESDVGHVFQFDVPGFSKNECDVWDLTTYRVLKDFVVTRSTGGNPGIYTLMFQDTLPSVKKYCAQTSSKRLAPDKMVLDTAGAEWSFSGGCDYVMIAPDSFLTILAPLAEYYQNKGMIVKLLNIDDIYNDFSWGIRDPESIRSCIKYLYGKSGNRPPRYLLLGGDATHDLDKKNRSRTIVPTHLSRVPGWGPSSDDDYFALVSGDDYFSDMSVGRFPAEDRLQMRVLVDKTLAYLRHPEMGFWRDNILMGGGFETDFTKFNDAVIDEVIGPRMNVERMDADVTSTWYVSDNLSARKITGFLNSGIFLLNFNGHGGGNVWSDSRFFSYSDLDNLYNAQWGKSGHLPFIFSFTCLTGFFESANYRSLGEEFVRKNKNGAIGFYGASAYTSKPGNLAMNRTLLEYALEIDSAAIGDILHYTEMMMLVRDAGRNLPLVRQYNYLGDPAMTWRLAPDSMHLALNETALDAGDTLKCTGSTTAFASGQTRVQISADAQNWSDQIVPLNSGNFSTQFLPKNGTSTSRGVFRAYAWNDSQQVRGWVPFSKDNLILYNVSIDPLKPFFGDSIAVSCKLAIPESWSFATIFCLYATAPSNKSQITFSGAIMNRQPDSTYILPSKIPIAFSGDIGESIILKFQAISPKGSRETGRYVFPIGDRPDLTFTRDTLRPLWRNDSLTLDFGVLNAGKSVSPPFSVTLFWGDGTDTDTLTRQSFSDSLAIGAIANFHVAIPDTQGTFSCLAFINVAQDFIEMSRNNNHVPLVFSLRYADLKNIGDTLWSERHGAAFKPVANFAQPHRVFLFAQKPDKPQPLLTPSSWFLLRDDSLAMFSIGIRPALNPAETLSVIFFEQTTTLPVEVSVDKKKALTDAAALFRLDTLLDAWRYDGGVWDPVQSSLIAPITKAGSIAPAVYSDFRAPGIIVSVAGRNISFLDYAAKDKPFTIFITDPSGIVPSSINISLNGTPIPENNRSTVSSTTLMTTVAVTTYPQKVASVDRLTVVATDCAGNNADTSFAYISGEELSIRFLSCHPNPFSAKQSASGETKQLIRFAFLLTDVASSVTISVYTISGKRIRTWELSNLIGYQELAWDGKTQQGMRIANGTYYLKLVAKNDRKTVSRIIRIAKLEGY